MSCPRDDEIADLLDFALVTHNHDDHASARLLKAMQRKGGFSSGKPVVSAFLYTPYVARFPKTFTFGDCTVETGVSDHNPHWTDSMTPYKVTCGRGSDAVTLLHAGDGWDARQLAHFGHVDIAIVHVWPFDGHNAEKTASVLKPDLLVVSHAQEMSHGFGPGRWDWSACEEEAARATAAGTAEEVYEPRFMYHGYQYVTIRGLATAPQIEDVTGCIVSTDFKDAGDFRCSDKTFNTLMLQARRSYRSNFANGFPTDCPHREKNGWTGDAAIASRLAQYLFENTAGYEKWLADICDAQDASGAIPGIVPTSGWGFHWGNGPVWDSALPFVAWNLYLYRGDRRILDRVYPALTRYVAFLEREKIRDGLIDWGLDDWVPPDQECKPTREYVVSAYAVRILGIAADMADLKGLGAEAVRFRTLAGSVRLALREKYRKAGGVWDNGGETAQAIALEFGLCEGAAEIAAAQAALVKAFADADDHLTMGIVGMTQAFRALSSAGRTDLAFKVLTQPTAPSPAAWIARGSTSLWEDWEEGGSRNHIMFGDFAAWAYERLAGIVPIEPGFRRFRLAPEPIEALDFVEAETETPYGKIKSAWRRTEGRVSYRFVVPAGTRADVRLPDGTVRMLDSGEYVFP